MTQNGAFSFVLHTHLPYARLAGRWPHGEEWIHEAISETYIPLLLELYKLKEEGLNFCLTLGITPILAEQLADETILVNFNAYLDDKILAAKRDMYLFAPANVTHFESLDDAIKDWKFPRRDDLQNPHLHYLAEWYKTYYETVKRAFNDQFQKNIIGAFKYLQDEGYLEIITSAATHAYLPLLSRDSSLKAQIELGVQSYERHFGRKPRGIWLPECAYRPATEGRVGLETILKQFGLKVFFSETHTVTGGNPVGVAGGDVLGPYGEIKRRYTIPNWQTNSPKRDASTFLPYYVSDSSKGDSGLEDHSGVAIVARNSSTGQQVWSSEWGYPGDFDYREFHKKAGSSGLQYWRVTGAKIDLDHKDMYHPDWASFKVDQHAEHYAHLVGDLLRDYRNQTGKFGLIASSYDTELFGHWWFEGVQWLGKVLRHLIANTEIRLMGVSDYLEQYPPEKALDIPETSWGAGGNHFTWDNGETHWMWQHIHAAELRMETLAKAHPKAKGDELAVLNQAARELLLLESSDWEFLVTTGQARNYAIQRFSQHVDRFNRLAASIEMGKPDKAHADELYELDKVFTDIHYRIFAD